MDEPAVNGHFAQIDRVDQWHILHSIHIDQVGGEEGGITAENLSNFKLATPGLTSKIPHHSTRPHASVENSDSQVLMKSKHYDYLHERLGD